MFGLCAIAWLFGSAIRHNIRHVEQELPSPSPSAAWIERASGVALAFAYFISVAYYLNLFAAFALRLVDVTHPQAIRIAASVAIAVVGATGAAGGLRAVERLEVGAVGIKLALIGGLISALLVATSVAVYDGTYAWHAVAHDRGLQELRVLLGLVILVQGFETSRYLGDAYDAGLRIRTMRRAQWISTLVYVVFIALITPWFIGGLPSEGGETLIVDMLRPLGVAVAPLIIVAALASQLSAACADMNGASGLLEESSGRRVPVRFGNLATAAVALAITWLANIYQIIAFASQAFVLYYALQSLQAARSCVAQGKHGRAVLFGAAALLAVAICVFALPARA
jgi:hypothetical protein